MSPFEVREEVLNVILADLLSERDLLSVPESIRQSARGGGRRLPDVTVADLQGVRLVIEGRLHSGSGVPDTLLEAAKKRVEEGISATCLAVLYPPDLRRVGSLAGLRRALSRSRLAVRVVSEGGEGEWAETTLDGIGDILRRSYELLVNEDVVVSAVDDLRGSIDAASVTIFQVATAPARLEALLGIPVETEGEREEDERRAPSTREEYLLRVPRIASLTVVNAMIFHQILSHWETRIQPLSRMIESQTVSESLADSWSFVLDNVDYVPIFRLARNIVMELSGNPGIDGALRILARSALRITARRAALRHDLMGRIYHRLLADAKYFGAFYTTIPAATLLLKLTLDPQHVNIDWSDSAILHRLRIADLACGTGTLLKAALQSIVDNYVRDCASKQITPDLKVLHKGLVEECLWGFDVIPFAIHLAASALAVHEPEVRFGRMRLYTLPLRGYPENAIRLGSLDFISGRRLEVQSDLQGAVSGPGRITGEGEVSELVELPDLDLCVMNPPFTRSVGGNLLFGNAPEPERRLMQQLLGRLVASRHINIQANITAGLGSVFAAIGARQVRPGGQIALVLPRALLSGVAWEPTRRMLADGFHIRYIIVSHQPGAWNFSENTDLSECLLVGRRRLAGEAPMPTKVVNLWVRPGSGVDALTVADLIRGALGAHLDSAGTQELRTDGRKYGEVILCSAQQIQSLQWGMATAFAQTELCRVAYNLARNAVYIPTRGSVGGISLTEVRQLATVGPDRRDIHDGFTLAGSRTAYPAFWGHDTESIQHLSQEPSGFLSPLAHARRRRPLRDAHLLWSRAGRLLVAERLWLTTVRTVCVRLPRPVLSNTWWPLAVSDTDGVAAEDVERILALWFNCSLGMISVIAARVDTRGPWIDLKKPVLERLRVLDPRSLSRTRRHALTRAYEELATLDLARLPEIDRDEVRAQIDSAIADALELPDNLRVLREMLASEPIIRAT